VSHAATPQGQRIHEVQATVAPWRGTPAQLVRVLSRAAEQLVEETDTPPTVWVEARYRDGRDLFEDMPALEAASTTLPIHRLVAITANLTSPREDRIYLHASRKEGVMIELESRREVFVLGARSVLESLLRENREDRVINRLVAVGIGVTAALMAGAVIADSSVSGNLAAILLIAAVATLGLTIFATPAIASRSAQLILLSVEQASSSEPGPILRIQAWIQRHPVIGLVLVFALGVATNEVRLSESS
jgi:hypothetical protein